MGYAELDYRENDGLSVALLWDTDFDRVVIRVKKIGADSGVAYAVPSDKALQAFNHPFAFAPSRDAIAELVTR